MKLHCTSADPEMQSHIDACISNGSAEFEVFVLVCLKTFGKRPFCTTKNPCYLFDPWTKFWAQFAAANYFDWSKICPLMKTRVAGDHRPHGFSLRGRNSTFWPRNPPYNDKALRGIVWPSPEIRPHGRSNLGCCGALRSAKYWARVPFTNLPPNDFLLFLCIQVEFSVQISCGANVISYVRKNTFKIFHHCFSCNFVSLGLF